VAEARAGVSVAPDTAAVVHGLRELLATPEAERQAMGQRGRAFVLAEHTYPVLAQRFLQACVASQAVDNVVPAQAGTHE
jgi:hypothetical protein